MIRVAKHPTAIIVTGTKKLAFLPVVRSQQDRPVPVFQIKENA
jgi:hypothetical protein